MKKIDDERPDLADLDQLIEEITVDSYGEDEQLWAFLQVISDEVAVPCDGFVIGEPVSIMAFDYDGHERRGLTARCRRADGSEHVVAASDVVFSQRSAGARYIAAYRKWMGLEPLPAPTTAPTRRKRQHKVAETDIKLSGPVELVVLAVKEKAAPCRLLGRDRIITLRPDRTWNLVPGELVVIKPRKQWSYAGHPYLSGEVESTRLDVAALGLVPLKLEDQGIWRPEEHYWGEKNEPIEEWAGPIIARGPRQMFEMEQILPGEDPDDPHSDPILEADDLKEAGDYGAAQKILMDLCQADLRCLDAHAHLGNFSFNYRPAVAIRHYEVGVRIGELSLASGFDGLLPWGFIDNRQYLRCLQGFGLSLWRLGRFEEAGQVFDRMLWLNPWDNQGVRFLIDDVRAGRPWRAD